MSDQQETNASDDIGMLRRVVDDKQDDIVPIRQISARFQPQIAIHLLALGERDRYLRFGYAASDQQIRDYVKGIDFERDVVYGIFNRKLRLIAMAHLALMDTGALDASAEFGVSVLEHARGRGYGKLLFERAATHAVNSGIERLYIYALSENTAMLHIAHKAGAIIEHMGGESEACVRLPEPTFGSMLEERLASHVGYVDYWLKAGTRAPRREESDKNTEPADGVPLVRHFGAD